MYLRDKDFELFCDSQTLTQVVNADSNLRKLCEFTVEDDIKSYLAHRYNFDKPYGEFTDTLTYDHITAYKARNRVTLNGTAYAVLTAYVPNNIVSYQNNVYVCILNSTGNLPTNTTYWTLLGAQYDLYFINYPNNLWDFQTAYRADDVVWYKDKNYTCVIGNTNIAPDSYGALSYWGAGVDYSVSAGTFPSNTAYWTNGDNRNNKIMAMYINMVVYYMFLKVAPKNIPNSRMEYWKEAVQWLKDAGAGMYTVDVTLKTPEQGSRLRWGSIPQSENIY